MEIKKFNGETLEEALSKARLLMGDDIVILNSREIKEGGIFSFFKKPKYEVLVGKESKSLGDNNQEEISSLKSEIEDLKLIMKRLPQELSNSKDLDENLKPINRILVSNGVDKDISHKFLEDFERNSKIKITKENVRENILIEIEKFLGNPNPIEIGDEQKVLFFVGPTGVGKTTTLAKLASNLVLDGNYDIGLITADTYRVGAVEQLKIYSDILNVDLEIAYDAKDIKKYKEKMKDKDVILIDTAGRNHNDLKQKDDLKNILEAVEQKQIFLLISANSDIKGLENLAAKYRFLPDYEIIVTKVDEANSLGGIFNIKYIFDKEISYYTMGQDVPEDINIIDTKSLSRELIKE